MEVTIRLRADLAEKLDDLLYDHCDEGPLGSGWASPELEELCAIVDAAVKGGPEVSSGDLDPGSGGTGISSGDSVRPKWTVTHNGKSVTADTLFGAMKEAQSLRTDEEAQVAAENLLRAIDEELTQEAGQARGGNTPYDEGPFTLDAQAAPAATVGLDALREAVSDFRKAAVEFAKGMDQDDHKRMMEAQKRIFDAALAGTPTAKGEGDL